MFCGYGVMRFYGYEVVRDRVYGYRLLKLGRKQNHKQRTSQPQNFTTAKPHNRKTSQPYNPITVKPHNPITVKPKQMDIFSKIAAGEIPSYKCAEDDKFYAFLDINPLAKGHTLVIPRREVDYFFDLEDDELAEMIVFAKRVAKAIKAAFPCRKVGMAVLGLEVAHAHIHLVPMQSEGDMNFANPKLKLTEAEFEETARKIREKF